MVRTRKHAPIPEGMALVETASGRWFPACALFSDIPNQIDVLEISPLIPPALDTLHDSEPGYVCREEAIEACRSWCEAVALTEYWRGLAARTELYPERNAWYLDEAIETLYQRVYEWSRKLGKPTPAPYSHVERAKSSTLSTPVLKFRAIQALVHSATFHCTY